MGVGKMNKKEEAVVQLKNCEEMHIWVKPIKDYIEELEAKEQRAKKEHELLGLYRLHYRNGMEYNHNGKLIHQIVKLEGELK